MSCSSIEDKLQVKSWSKASLNEVEKDESEGEMRKRGDDQSVEAVIGLRMKAAQREVQEKVLEEVSELIRLGPRTTLNIRNMSQTDQKTSETSRRTIGRSR